MSTPTSIIELSASHAPAALWAEIAARSIEWARAQQVELRDAIVLLPFVALLSSARRAFAAAGGWMPRIETAQTLAASLGPPSPHEAGQLTLDAAFDALLAAPMLERQASLRGWPQRDRRGFDIAVRRVVETAHDLVRAAATIAPSTREAWFAQARARLAPLAADPAATERLLARIALEWAAHAPSTASDALFGLRPSAWIVLRAGGAAPLLEALAACGDVPALILDADAALRTSSRADDGFDVMACDGFEDEAQSAAASVLDHLARSRAPVALIAQDRLLVRRVRALLARQRVPMADETGWRLSTTRAAAQVMTLLRAARAQASCDDVLDWLKAGSSAAGVDALEVALRRRGFARAAAVDAAHLEGAGAQASWHAAMRHLAPLRVPVQRPLAAWRAALRDALTDSALEHDAAGAQVLDALFGLPREHAAPFDLRTFIAWVDATLEQASFLPRDDSGDAAVVITPLARAMLRPFGAIVLPSADATRLGATPAAHPLLGDTLAVALGLRGVAAQREVERVAFAQLQRVPALTVLYRHRDGDEPLAPSPLLERMTTAQRRTGLRVPSARSDPRGVRAVQPQPLSRPLPVPRGVPGRLSASALDALRDCPYRFFSRSLLALRDADELDDEPEKRDYGKWLHAVLLRFHREREGSDAAGETARLLAIGREQRDADRLDAASFLPFFAAFERFAPMYVVWQRQRDAEGSSFVDGEVERSARPEPLAGVELKGRIDRIDRASDGTVVVLDYKTGALQGLRERLRDPLEDTQLATYALLAGTDVRAAYVALDDPRGIHLLEHRDVGAAAAALLDGIADELQRVREGAPLPALGEGRVCETCEARGLCRRDDWAA